MNEEMENAGQVVIPPSRDEYGRTVFNHALTPRSDTRDKVLMCKLPAVIPVIFVPGIMGTNLRYIESKEKVWRPPNVEFSLSGIGQALVAMFTWMFRGPAERQKMLNGAILEPDPRGPIDVGNAGITEKVARERNWGTLMSSAYHPVMARLQQDLNGIPAKGIAGTPWEKWAQSSAADYGEELGNAPGLTEDEWKQACRYRFDVWAGGYNWLQSNRDSAQALKDYIENTVLAYYRKQCEPADKVILLTHSMGGLVARALTKVLNYDKVLGVVHGVMPATGAPATYHHCRCGYEGASQVILGRNAGEVTGVLANSPGGLELLPTHDYGLGMQWLQLHDTRRNLRRCLPERGNAYEEIYTSTEWYGLVPLANTKYLDLAKKNDSEIPNSKKDFRERFNMLIKGVERFHSEIYEQYHDETYVHFGDDVEQKSYGTTVWSGDWLAMSEFGVSTFRDDGNGHIRADSRLRGSDGLRFLKALEPGDGTVPTLSGQAPMRASIRAGFRHGSGGKGSMNEKAGYKHQPSYNEERSQWASAYSILKLAQLADWYEK